MDNPIVNSIIVQTRTTGVDDAIREVGRLERQVLTFQRHLRGIGQQPIYTAANDIKQLKAFDYQFAKAMRPGVKSAGAFLTNIANVSKALRSQRVAGIATARSIANLTRETRQYDTTALRALSTQQKMKVMSHAVGIGLTDLGRKYQRLGRDMQWVGRTMIMGVSVPMAAGATVAIKAWNRLDEQVTRVQKVTTSKQFDKLGGADGVIKSARELGNEFGIVSEMVAAVQGDFAAMGYTAKQDLDGITKLSLEISRLGEVDLADSTKAVRSVVEIFGDLNDPIGSASDILYTFNAIENNTAIGLKDLIPAFPQVANAAKNFGLTAEETAAAMAGMYEQGIPASEVATSLKYVLASLIKPTQQTKDMITELAKTQPQLAQVFRGLETGSISGRDGLEQLSKAYQDLVAAKGVAEASELLVNIVGKRQVNRVLALFNSIEIARSEALETTGVADISNLTGIDPDELQSDYARALAVSGKSEEGRVENAKRAQRELNAIYRSDAFRREKSLAQLKTAFADFGRIISGPVSDAIDKLASALKRITDFLSANPLATKLAMGAAVAAAAMGLLIFIVGQTTQVLFSFGLALGKVLFKFSYFAGEAVRAASAADLLNGKIFQGGDFMGRFEGPLDRVRRKVKDLGTIFRGTGGEITETVDDLVAAEIEMERKVSGVSKVDTRNDAQIFLDNWSKSYNAKAAAAAASSEVVEVAAAAEVTANQAVKQSVDNVTITTQKQTTAQEVLDKQHSKVLKKVTAVTAVYDKLAASRAQETAAIEANTAALERNNAASMGGLGTIAPGTSPAARTAGLLRNEGLKREVIEAVAASGMDLETLDIEKMIADKEARMAQIISAPRTQMEASKIAPRLTALATQPTEILLREVDNIAREYSTSEADFRAGIAKAFKDIGTMPKGDLGDEALEAIRRNQIMLAQVAENAKRNFEKLVSDAMTVGLGATPFFAEKPPILGPPEPGPFAGQFAPTEKPKVFVDPAQRGLPRLAQQASEAVAVEAVAAQQLTLEDQLKDIDKKYASDIGKFDDAFRKQIQKDLQSRVDSLNTVLREAESQMPRRGRTPEQKALVQTIKKEIATTTKMMGQAVSMSGNQLKVFAEQVKAMPAAQVFSAANAAEDRVNRSVADLISAQQRLEEVRASELPSLTKEQESIARSIDSRKATIAKLEEGKAVATKRDVSARRVAALRDLQHRNSTQLQALEADYLAKELEVQRLEDEFARTRAGARREQVKKDLTSAKSRRTSALKAFDKQKAAAARSARVFAKAQAQHSAALEQLASLGYSESRTVESFATTIKGQTTQLTRDIEILDARKPVGVTTAQRNVSAATTKARAEITEQVRQQMISDAQRDVDDIMAQMKAPGKVGRFELDDIPRVSPVSGQLLGPAASKRLQLQQLLDEATQKLHRAQTASAAALSSSVDAILKQKLADADLTKKKKQAADVIEDATVGESRRARKERLDATPSRLAARRERLLAGEGDPRAARRLERAQLRLADVQAKEAARTVARTQAADAARHAAMVARNERETGEMMSRAYKEHLAAVAASTRTKQAEEAVDRVQARAEAKMAAERAAMHSRRAARESQEDVIARREIAARRLRLYQLRKQQALAESGAFAEPLPALTPSGGVSKTRLIPFADEATAQLLMQRRMIANQFAAMTQGTNAMFAAQAEAMAQATRVAQAQMAAAVPALGPGVVQTAAGPLVPPVLIPGQTLAYRKELAAFEAAQIAAQAEQLAIAENLQIEEQARVRIADEMAEREKNILDFRQRMENPTKAQVKQNQIVAKSLAKQQQAALAAQKSAATTARRAAFAQVAISGADAGAPRGLLHRLFGVMDPTVQTNKFMGRMLAPVQRGISRLASVIPAGGILGRMLGGAGAAGSVSGTLFTGLMSALGSIPMMFVAITAAAVGLIALLAKLSGHWDAFFDGVKSAAKPAMGFLKGAWSAIKDALMALWEGVKAIWEPFKNVLNSIMAALSGEDSGGKQKKAASGWNKIGKIIGGIATVFSFIVKVLAEIVKIIAKIVAFVMKFIGAVIQLIFNVLQLHLIFKPIGLIFKNWNAILNRTIGIINEIIKGINLINPFQDIQMIAKVPDKEKFNQDFKKFVDQIGTGASAIDTELLIDIKVQERLGEMPSWVIDNMTKQQRQKFENLIEIEIRQKVNNAENKLDILQTRRTKILGEQSALQSEMKAKADQLVAAQKKLHELSATGGIEYHKQLSIVQDLQFQYDTLVSQANKYKNKLQEIVDKLVETKGFTPDALSIFSEEAMYNLSLQQKRLKELEGEILEAQKKVAKAQEEYTGQPGQLEALNDAKQKVKELETEATRLAKQRMDTLRQQFAQIPETIRQNMSFEDYVAYVNVTYKYDEFTVGTKPEDRIADIMKGMPTVFGKTFSAAEEAAIEAAQKFADTLKSKLDDITGKLKDAALKAFEEGAKGRIAAIDAQIKAMDDAAKAEQELFETEQYYANRRKMLNNFATTSENYRRDRAKAIYQGRYDDARMLDLQYQADTKSHQEELSNLDNDRSRTLVEKERDAQRERLEAQKEALQQQLDLQKQHFQDMLEVITEYTPRNVGELQAMINAMNDELANNGFPLIQGTFASGTALWSEATRSAGADLADAAYWAGLGAANAAVAGMTGVTPEFTQWLSKLKPADQTAVRDAINRFLAGTPTAASISPEARATMPAWAPNDPNWWRYTLGLGTFHAGGMVGGKSAPRDVPAVLQTGEFVMQRKAVDKLGVGFLSSLNKYHEGGLVGKSMRSLMFGNLGVMYANMLTQGAAFAGITMSVLKSLLQPKDLSKLVGTGATGGMEAQPTRMPVDINDLIVTPFKEFLAFIFPNAADAIMRGSTYREGPGVSFHSTGQAVDIGDALASQDQLSQIFEFLIPRVDKFDIVELIFRNMQYDKGPGWRAYTGTDHYDHIHVAVGRRLNEIIAESANFFTPLLRGGKIPVDNLPALLHKGEVVLPANIVRNIENANQNGGGDTYICVDTFIGQRQWFDSMMKEYNMKTLPAEQRRRGTMNRVVSSRKDNTVRYV